jgi:hypothetical protein
VLCREELKETVSPIKGKHKNIQKEKQREAMAYHTYPLRSPHRSPAAAALPFDAAAPVAPDIECARFRPTTACASPFPLWTKTSAGAAVVVVVVVLGMTKYRPIARRTAPFAALAMPPSSIVGVVTGPLFIAGGRFLYYIHICTKNSAHEGRKGEGAWAHGGGPGAGVGKAKSR